MTPEIGCNHDTLQRFGKVGSGEDFKTTKFGLSWVESSHDAFGSRRRGKDRAGENVIDPMASGTISGKGLAKVVKDKSPGVDQPL